MITDKLVDFANDTPIDFGLGAGNYDSNVVDLYGNGPGSNPDNIIGNRALFGQDDGIGGIRPQIEVILTEAGAGGTSLQVLFQGAPDTAVTFLPGTWVTLVETPAILLAQLTLGQKLARYDWPPAFPELTFSPRFFRIRLVAVGAMSAGMALIPCTMVRDDNANRAMPRNYAVA